MTENNTQTILEVAKAVGAHLELSDVLAALISTLKPVVHFDLIGVGIIEGEVIRIHSIHIEGFRRRAGESPGSLMARFAPELDSPQRFPLSEHPVSETLASRRPYVRTDLETQRRFPHDERCLDYGLRSYVGIPLVKQGELIGVIEYLSKEKGSYTDEQVQLLRGVSDMVSLAVANALAYEEIKRLKEQLQAENLMLQDEIVERSSYEEIVGSSPSLQRVLASIEKVARTDSTVIITGETGTGKELVAHAIHRRSPRAARALVKVNLAALPKELIASELFGHEKGAFTGAMQQRAGRFEAADGGTLFLDEVGELSPEMQVALLRVLQEREFERVGGSRTIKTDVRVIAATNRDLRREVAEGRFRVDLYYRLNVFPVHVPPLRERDEDIPVLVDYFAARAAAQIGKRIRQIERRSLDSMQAYSWPGNIRELQNVIERCVILAEGEVLRLEPGTLVTETQQPEIVSAAPAKSTGMKAEIEAALRETRGRVAGPKGAAVRLGVPVTTLASRIRALKINKYQFY
ncbi:MAG: sigma 54-interacting transcriptional regulator [Acidobacteria bacterium]|nr:sigma 54-interacting transcriptional regulator [Acidobacteriota bacterium]